MSFSAGATLQTVYDFDGSNVMTLTGVNAGDSIRISVAIFDATATITSVTINGESNATLIGTQTTPNAGLTNASVQNAALGTVTAGATKTVTVNLSAGVNCECWADSVSSGTGGATLDVQDSSGTAGVVNLTTTQNNDTIWGIAVSGAAPGTPGGYTLVTMPGNVENDAGFYDLDVGAAGLNTITTGTVIAFASLKANVVASGIPINWYRA